MQDVNLGFNIKSKIPDSISIIRDFFYIFQSYKVEFLVYLFIFHYSFCDYLFFDLYIL